MNAFFNRGLETIDSIDHRVNRMTYEQVFSNADLKRYIFCFGTPKHRETMKQVCHDILVKHTDALLSNVPDIYPYTRDDRVFLYDMTMRESLTRLFQLRLCKCCSRHAHNKPDIKLHKSKDFHGVRLIIQNKRVWVPECKDFGDCNCECRQETRHLARLIRHRSHLHSTIL